jgi:hypothetical protein
MLGTQAILRIAWAPDVLTLSSDIVQQRIAYRGYPSPRVHTNSITGKIGIQATVLLFNAWEKSTICTNDLKSSLFVCGLMV